MTTKRVPNIVRGGVAIPLKNKTNYYYMAGRKHSQGGIDVGDNPRTGLEVEDGEVMHISKNDVKVFSSVPFLNGKSPAQKVMGGENPNNVFKAQESFKRRNKINNDGTKKKRMGGLSRKQDYGSKSKPYPNVKAGDFAGGGRSYPIPTKADAVDALRLAGLHGRSDVKAKVYNKYPELRKKSKAGGLYSITVNGKTKLRMFPSTGEEIYTTFGSYTRDKALFGKGDAIGRANRILQQKQSLGYDIHGQEKVDKPVVKTNDNSNNKDKENKVKKVNISNNANISNNDSNSNNTLGYIIGTGTGIGAGSYIGYKGYKAYKKHSYKDLINHVDNTIESNLKKPKEFVTTSKDHSIDFKSNKVNNSPIPPKSTTDFDTQFKNVYKQLADEDVKLNKTGNDFIEELEKRFKAGEVKRGGSNLSEVEQRRLDKVYKKAVGNTEPRSGFSNKYQSTEITYTPKSEVGRTYDATAEINQQRALNKQKATIDKMTKGAKNLKQLKGIKSIVGKSLKGFGVVGDFIEPIYNTLFASPEEQKQIRLHNYRVTGNPKYLEKEDLIFKYGGKQKLKYGGRRKALYGLEDNTTKVWLPSLFGQKYDREVELPTISTMNRPFMYNGNNINNIATNNAGTKRNSNKKVVNSVNPVVENKLPPKVNPIPSNQLIRNAMRPSKQPVTLDYIDTNKNNTSDNINNTNNKDNKFNNFINNYGSDILGLTSNTIGGIISHSMNKNMLNNLKYNSQPIARNAAKLKTRININPQLDKMRESLASYERDIDTNTASSRVALARKQRARLANMLQTNELFGNKENIETELINKDKLNQQSVADANIRDYNTWSEKKAAFENAVREKKAENDVSLIGNLNSGIQDIIGRREKRNSERQTRLAMAAANPNVNPRILRDLGIKGITDSDIERWDKAFTKKKKKDNNKD